MVGAGNIARAAGAGAHPGGGFDHRADHLRMLAHAKVIVRAPDHDLTRTVRGMPCCVRKATGDALEIRKHTVASFLMQAGKRGGKEMIVGHGQNLRPGFAQQLELRHSSESESFRALAISAVIRRPGGGAAGPWGEGPAAGPAWGGRGKRAGRRALAMLSASAKQIGM